MEYYSDPQAAIVIAQSRSGSTFLCHCLDSHPQIGCERGGPFDTRFNKWHELGVEHRALAAALWRRRGYRVSMFKVTQRQFKNGYMTTDVLREFQPKIIYRHRVNVFNALVSSVLATASRDGKASGPIHTYQAVKQQEIKIDCDSLIDRIEVYLQRTEAMRQVLSEFDDVLELTYERIVTGGSPRLAIQAIDKICTFLGVDWHEMQSETVKINTAPIISNEGQVKYTLRDTAYDWMKR